MFYILLFFIALLQNLLFISTKYFIVFSPNIVLALLYCHHLKNQQNFVIKGAVSGFFLDIMFGTLGLNIAIKSFICYLIEITKLKLIYIPTFISHLIIFSFFSIFDLFLRYTLLRLKYEVKLDYGIVIISFLIELATFSLFYAIYKRV